MMRNKYVNIKLYHTSYPLFIPRASMPGWACLCRASITCNSWTNKVLDQQSLNIVVCYNFSRVYSVCVCECVCVCARTHVTKA